MVTLTALGEAFRWFRQRNRHVELQVIEGLMPRVLPRLRDGTLDLAAVATDVGEIGDDEFHCRRLLTAPQRIVVREGLPVLADRSARALAAQEWVLTQPAGSAAQPRIDAMFALAGVAAPMQVLCCETLAAMTILRHSDGVSLFPELVLLSRPDMPLKPAAAYFAHCLASVCGRSPVNPAVAAAA